MNDERLRELLAVNRDKPFWDDQRRRIMARLPEPVAVAPWAWRLAPAFVAGAALVVFFMVPGSKERHHDEEISIARDWVMLENLELLEEMELLEELPPA